MIIQERKALFGGRTTDIDTEKFICVVTTAKESLMEGLSTIIWSHSVNGECAKLLYNDFLSKASRQRLHHNICQIIDSEGESGTDLGCAIDEAIKELEKKDFLMTSVNLLGCYN
jgi:hypothetical protein